MITVVGPFALLDDLKGPEAVIIRSPAQVCGLARMLAKLVRCIGGLSEGWCSPWR